MAGRKRSLLDRALGALGLVRRSRTARRGAFAGAYVSRLTADWVTSILSADQEIRGDLRLLRARARELARDNPHAKQFLRLLASNVVGPRGIRLQARVRDGSGDLDRGVNANLEGAWRDWGQPGYPSVDGRHSFVDLERLALTTIATDGEFLARRRVVDTSRNPYAFSLQVLDADLLDENYSRAADTQGNRVSMGVEIDRDGRPIAYHLWSSHPSDMYEGYQRERVRVPASEIVHLFVPFRLGQSRGVPWFAPVLLALRMLDGYFEAEIVAARLAAAKQGFIKTDPEHADAWTAPAEGETALQMDAEPGQLHQLNPGQAFEGWDPQHPTTAFDPFTKAVQRMIAAGVGASYAGITGDLAEANYSSMRVGLLQERDEWLAMQGWYSSHFHNPLYRDWLKLAALTGMVQLPTYEVARWTACQWLGRGWPWVDPLKDVQASAIEMRLGLNTRTALCAERGLDFEEVLEQLAEEQALAEAYGVVLTTDLGKPITDQETTDGTGASAGGGRAAAGDVSRGDHHRADARRLRRFSLS